MTGKFLLLILVFKTSSSNNTLKSGIQITSGIGGEIFTTLILYKLFPVSYNSGDITKVNAHTLIFNTALGLTLGSSLGIIISGKILKVEGSKSGSNIGFFNRISCW